MSNPRILKEVTDLKNSRFGRPYPRHGLKLLYWFANEFMVFNNNNKMCCQYNPKTSFYGFHRFKNRKDKNGVKLLPEANLTYYVVGNLNSDGAEILPKYVREDHSSSLNGSNMDRIIISVDDESIESVYVTEHSDRIDFDKEATFFISKELLMMIREMTFEEFLRKSGYSSKRQDYGPKPGVTKPQGNYSQKNRFSNRANEDQVQKKWVSRQAKEDQGQRNWFSRTQKNNSQRTRDLDQQVSTVDSTVVDESTRFGEDNETSKCCRCIIL